MVMSLPFRLPSSTSPSKLVRESIWTDDDEAPTSFFRKYSFVHGVAFFVFQW